MDRKAEVPRDLALRLEVGLLAVAAIVLLARFALPRALEHVQTPVDTSMEQALQPVRQSLLLLGIVATATRGPTREGRPAPDLASLPTTEAPRGRQGK